MVGGNGGNGGSVYLECDPNLNTLALLRRCVHHRGRDGKNGQGKSRHGQKGDDCIIPVSKIIILFIIFMYIICVLSNLY